ncbi:MAG: chemotaxis protein CheD [Candidatus Omnitrophica bacterium]|nr:chemotaxis protein CheD [Candidatus Omnitrophota bacterium]
MNEMILIQVGVADIKVSKAPAMLMTNLGSCIAVCLYYEQGQIGGMLHLMMPRADEKALEYRGFKKEKYANTGIRELVYQIKQQFRVDHSMLTAKIFGGGRILQNVSLDIGADNAKAAQDILRELGIRIIASKVGGTKGYNIRFDLSTGKVRCQIFGEQEQEF